MKKRIVLSIAFLMILCLALAGCALRDSRAETPHNEPARESFDGGGVDNSENVEIDDDVDPISDDTEVFAGGYFVGMSSDDGYQYNINGVELTVCTDITDFIDGNAFMLTDLAYNLGWHVRKPNDPTEPNVMRFWDDSEEKFVGFGSNKKSDDGKQYYDWVSYNQTNVAFDRLDVGDDSIPSYYVNKGGIPPYSVNEAQIIVLTYLFENAANIDDPLDGLVGAGSETHYRIRQ